MSQPENIEEINYSKAMEILNTELVNNKQLKTNFLCALRNSHPDRNKVNGASEQYKIISYLYQIWKEYTENDYPTRKLKIDMRDSIFRLPFNIRKRFLDKIITENSSLKEIDLLFPVIHSVDNNYIGNSCQQRKTRDHLFPVHGWSFNNLNLKFQRLNGDLLKSTILEELQIRIEETSSKEELSALKSEIKKSPEYKALAKGQGATTRFFHLQTSSLKELKSMFKQQERNISSTLDESGDLEQIRAIPN